MEILATGILMIISVKAALDPEEQQVANSVRPRVTSGSPGLRAQRRAAVHSRAESPEGSTKMCNGISAEPSPPIEVTWTEKAALLDLRMKLKYYFDAFVREEVQDDGKPLLVIAETLSKHLFTKGRKFTLEKYLKPQLSPEMSREFTLIKEHAVKYLIRNPLKFEEQSLLKYKKEEKDVVVSFVQNNFVRAITGCLSYLHLHLKKSYLAAYNDNENIVRFLLDIHRVHSCNSKVVEFYLTFYQEITVYIENNYISPPADKKKRPKLKIRHARMALRTELIQKELIDADLLLLNAFRDIKQTLRAIEKLSSKGPLGPLKFYLVKKYWAEYTYNATLTFYQILLERLYPIGSFKAKFSSYASEFKRRSDISTLQAANCETSGADAPPTARRSIRPQDASSVSNVKNLINSANFDKYIASFTSLCAMASNIRVYAHFVSMICRGFLQGDKSFPGRECIRYLGPLLQNYIVVLSEFEKDKIKSGLDWQRIKKSMTSGCGSNGYCKTAGKPGETLKGGVKCIRSHFWPIMVYLNARSSSGPNHQAMLATVKRDDILSEAAQSISDLLDKFDRALVDHFTQFHAISSALIEVLSPSDMKAIST